jgi:hypothetical protein
MVIIIELFLSGSIKLVDSGSIGIGVCVLVVVDAIGGVGVGICCSYQIF